MLENITKRERIMGAVTIGVALTALLYNFAVEPLLRQWKALDGRIKEKEIAFTKYMRIVRDKDIIEKLYSDYAPYVEDKKSSAEEENAAALDRIEKLARGANVRITNIKPLKIKNFGDYDKYSFRVATESGIEELSKMIYDLQSSPRLLKVDRMVLRAKDREPDVIRAMLQISKISVF